MRAILMASLISAPSLIVPSTGHDTAQIVVILSLIAGVMTFIEYYGAYPSIIEFRFAPPFNRLRYIALAVILIFIALVLRGTTDPSGLTVAVTRLGAALGNAVDFPYSPIRLFVLMLPENSDGVVINMVRIASGIAYTACLAMIIVFLTLVRFLDWPVRSGAFNVWVNLPLFDPTGGGDVLRRLRRDAVVNIVLGTLLPFLIPAAVSAASSVIDPISIAYPQTLIWMVTAWAFLPASMLMRGIAMSRIADMIEEKRRRTYAAEGQDKDHGTLQRA